MREERTNCLAAAGSADVESDEAWELYVYDHHILQDGDEIEAANYWHKLTDDDQERYRQKVRDSKREPTTLKGKIIWETQ